MTEDERRIAYARAFIAQARSDWGAYLVLADMRDRAAQPKQREKIAACHHLHYRQMVCEKVAKAYRLRDTKSPVDELVSHHVGFSKFINAFFTAVLKPEYAGKEAQLQA